MGKLFFFLKLFITAFFTKKMINVCKAIKNIRSYLVKKCNYYFFLTLSHAIQNPQLAIDLYFAVIIAHKYNNYKKEVHLNCIEISFVTLTIFILITYSWLNL